MNRSKASLFAWTFFTIITALALFDLVDTLVNRPAGDNLFEVLANALVNALFVIEFAFVAALIVARQPRNIIGWLMMALPLAFIMDVFSRSYLEQFPTPPAEVTTLLFIAVLFNNISWLFLIFPLFFTMLLFPDGRLPSPRWRWVSVAGLGLFTFAAFYILFQSSLSLLENEAWILANPIGLLPADTSALDTAFFVGLILMTLLCVAAPFVRYRRAAGVEREQIKWLFYATGLFALAYIPNFFLTDEAGAPLVESLSWVFNLAVMAIPAAIAIAILRYRLYDIDVIIRKTLLYGALTGLLALVYFGSVVLLQGLFEALTGQSSPIVIVISTLLIAALFIPLRRRLQRAIDRRFYRQKYDAQQVLAQFAKTARDEVELEALTAELARVTRETVQPESLTIWLREPRS